jgi:quinoprotein dehydrogenase-associated probable ABC transporter substrate-binding protein
MRVVSTCLFVLLSITVGPVQAQERAAFRVCADPNYMPFSNRAGEGFENHVAAMLAADLGLPIEYEWFPQRMGFIRNTLRSSDAAGEYKCDVVMGLPTGYELAVTTDPYYWSTYALVFVKGRGLDDIATPDELLNLEPDRLESIRFGIAERNPGAVWLSRHGLLDQIAVAYPSQPGDPAVQPGELEQTDLLAGKIDATIMWGPIAGYFAKHTKEAEVIVVPLVSEPGIRFHFPISAGVRFGEGDFKKQLQTFLSKNQTEIDAVLREYRVPLVDENGSLL